MSSYRMPYQMKLTFSIQTDQPPRELEHSTRTMLSNTLQANGKVLLTRSTLSGGWLEFSKMGWLGTKTPAPPYTVV